MKKWVFTFLLLFCSSFLHAHVSLKQRLVQGNAGDFIVTEQGSLYSILILRARENSRLILEEITVEASQIDPAKISWKKWVEKKAPEASSWISFAIDLEKNTLAQCFSHLQGQWLFIEKSDYILAQLLTLDLRPTKDTERKKIGPAPMPGEIDRRKLWQPSLIREGKKESNPHFDILRTIWPQDSSHLAGCVIEVYLDAAHPHFPFPHWIEIQSPHYTFKVRVIDSGSGISSPVPLLR